MENKDFKKQISKAILKNPASIEISDKEGAALLLDRADLSQRGYKNVKKILKQQNVQLPSYKSVKAFMKELPVGSLERSFCNCPEDVCMSCGSTVKESLTLFLNNPFWFNKLKFPTTVGQEWLFDGLKKLNNDIYKG